ncbi:MAG TPA: D-tyrosyl-tRNA(Tyr) deacylase [Kosmotogaceae bacterium]|nr:MAG: D-tyrosyl-tRNA(Tyr) deacylase [Thermotogales bacterium 46_20]HAA85526.1 D-tyrosyl-tRNA(Tyr) deacylase [Kosmotogaceae bacterium]
MRAVVQKVTHATVTVNGNTAGEIGRGLVVLLGVESGDITNDVVWMVNKIIHLRIFEDGRNLMNLSVQDIKGAILAVSQFTLLGDARKGRRPSFTAAASLETAEEMFNQFVDLASKYVNVQTGVFRAHMKVNLTNDGPVTILLDSKKQF